MKLPRSPNFSLEGKRAFVTGASSGIGLGACVALANYGASVLASARSEDKLIELEEEAKNKSLLINTKRLDISDNISVKNIIKKHGPFDIFVNSAGIARHNSLYEASIDEYDDVMNINTKSAYFCTKEIAKQMIDNKIRGSIINISSQMGHVGGLDRSIYCASKFAVEGFTKAMAIELGKHAIRINTICPTFIRTPLTESTFENQDKIDWVKQKIKLNRVGEVEDILGGIIFLASDASSLMTGSSLLIDGGWTVG